MANITFLREVGPVRWVVRTAIRQFYKRVLKKDQRMRLPTGEWIILPINNQFSTEAFITGGDVDWGSEALLKTMLTGRGVFLDIGAHIGYYSLYFLPLSPAVYSFEPDPRARVHLEKNLGGKAKVEIVPSAVGAAAGKASFTQAAEAAFSHLSSAVESGAGQIEVDVVTVDGFVAERGIEVEAIKIDAEDHDIEVLMGAMQVLEEQRPIVLTEAPADEVLFELTRRARYRVFGNVRPPNPADQYFMEFGVGQPVRGRTKMLFLVPTERADELVRNVKRVG